MKDFLWWIFFVFIAFQAIGFGCGLAEGTFDYPKCQTKGKYGYVFPLFVPACKATRWMGE
jgi:hypothetical protein